MNTITRTLAALATVALIAVGSLLAIAPASQAGSFTGGYWKCQPITKVDEDGRTWYFAQKCTWVKYPPMTPKTTTFRLAR